MRRIRILAALLMAAWGICGAQQAPDTTLGRHDFFYAGQGKQRRMFIVKDGNVDWQYADRLGKSEISDAMLMTDGIMKR